jgi:superfamily II DNA or RNA helicase
MESAYSLRDGLVKGFIDGNMPALANYRPRLLVNDNEKGEKVLTSIITELSDCDEFLFSVAFVTKSGVTSLIETLKELDEKGVKGRIIASQYQNFSDPAALRKLMGFGNIDLGIVTEDQGKMHTKGYIFRKSSEYTIIVGSSNLTQSALSVNKEWNLKVTSTYEGALLRETLHEFEELSKKSVKVDEAYLEQYQAIYDYQSEARIQLERTSHQGMIHFQRILPNKMQSSALEALDESRNAGRDKALVISATGTGKTYLSAFDVRKFNPRRFLFVVHREQIAKAAMESFRRVFGTERSMSVLSGGSKSTGSDFIFSTVQTLSKDEMLYGFKPDHFDYVVIDEVHRAGAASYRKVIDHFRPEFLLGMSATPERTDGFDVFQMFDHNVAFEIRLQQAMKENMVCPFHYFGVSEIKVDGVLIDDTTSFSKLTSNERVRNIAEKAEFYGYSGHRVRGLIFCSRREEAEVLSDKFNLMGYSTVALSGASSQEERIEAVNRLEQKERDGGLDYIFTVDIFNEGIDVPSVNQVIMLRPTQSAIIFVQQLGRGLRHFDDKEYVVVLDFIGNYDKNFLIPVALSGDQSYNKDTMRRFIAEGTRVIPGCSTINFDRITRDRIYSSIDRADLNDIKLIKESYMMLKMRLGRIPSINEFAEYGSIDIERIFQKSKSYHNFLKKYEDEYNVGLSVLEEGYIEYISVKYATGKRPHELELLKLIAGGSKNPLEDLEVLLKKKYGIVMNENTRLNLENQMTQNFATGSAKDSYKDVVFMADSKGADSFINCLENPEFRLQFEELLGVGLTRYQERYSERYKHTNFKLYEKYTYEDVCRCLDWEKSEVALNIGGYRFDKRTRTYPVFINYDKHEDISATTKYEDRFLSSETLEAISKSKRTVNSDDVVQAYNSESNGVTMLLFVRKNKDDRISKEFYFLGTMKTIGTPEEFTMPGTNVTAVKLYYSLHTPVRGDIYDFITR